MNTAVAGLTNAEHHHRAKEYLLPAMLHMYSEPLPLVEGKACASTTPNGRSTWTCSAGI